jgi:hypothetical protein
MRVLYLDYENYSTKKLIVEDIDLFFRLSIYFDLGIHGVFEVEQLLVFHGRCGFIQYMPSKPAKYGIKIFWICESDTGYALNGEIPHVGKQPGDPVHHNLTTDVVKKICASIYHSSRNVIMDNYFTSLPLLEYLFEKSLTVVGTLRQNKRKIPKEFKPNKDRLYFLPYLVSKKMQLL